MSTLWSRIRELMLRMPAMTSRDIACRLKADPGDVRRTLRVYASRGQVIRVVIRDNSRLHWRLAVRDPRRDPAVGDALQRGRITRVVVDVERLPTGALHKVHGPRGHFWHAASWRAWALDGAEIVQRGAT